MSHFRRGVVILLLLSGFVFIIFNPLSQLNNGNIAAGLSFIVAGSALLNKHKRQEKQNKEN